MIKYISTRGNNKQLSFSEIVLKGIASDGGLFVPYKIPTFSQSQLGGLLGKSYKDIAEFILKLFEIDFPKNEIKDIVTKAYGKNFDNSEIVPIIHLKDTQYLLELWHGPTSAFKDMALQIMPLFFSEAVKKDNKKRVKNGEKPLKYLILVATSGDTGKAALEGYKDKGNISIVVFYPNGHVSQLQELQMVTQEGSNVTIFAIEGDFDDTQRLVKDIFNDSNFNQLLLNKNQTMLSSANSINWGRLLPQIIYHISSYLALVNRKIITLGDSIDISVPTGNFGNILAAFFAMKMGLPIQRFICASNENNVLTQFLQTGIYDISKRKLIQTPSPSMDILVASNLERLLYLITANSEKVSQWMNELKSKGKFEVDTITKDVLKEKFYADWVSNNDCLQNIKKIFEKDSYLMDPHTSVAQLIANRYLQNENSLKPIIICSTAHWAKFAKDIHKALFPNKKASINEFSILKEIGKLTPKISIPIEINNLQKKKIRFTQKIVADTYKVEKIIISKVQSQV